MARLKNPLDGEDSIICNGEKKIENFFENSTFIAIWKPCGTCKKSSTNRCIARISNIKLNYLTSSLIYRRNKKLIDHNNDLNT